jgi:uncharacterized protein with ParB-like and HNH nuclease domain
MTPTLNAEQKSVYHIFSGENQYVIPPYQRAYSWTTVQCKALFEDIKRAFYSEEQEGYFLGNMVLAKSTTNKNRLEVIDGQQRLTTLILFLKVLSYFDKENRALYNAIWIKDRRTDEEIQRLETDIFMEKDSSYFKEVLAFDFSANICDSIKKEDNLFKKNICYFYNELKEFQKHNDINLFSDFLLDQIYLLPIKTEDVDADKARRNALQVFETINNRGINLSTSDIFKARLYSMALNELKHEEFITQWKELNKKCDELNYTIDNIFKIYSYLFIEEKEIFDKKINIRDYFLENKYSPFFHKQYHEIMNDLLKICDFILFFIKTMQNPNENQELSKWFQLIHQGISIGLLDERTLYQSLNLNKFDLNDNSLIDMSKKIICGNLSFKKESRKNARKRKLFGKNDFSLKDSFFILLGLTLDKQQKAIHPYLTFNNQIKSYTDYIKEEMYIDIQAYIDFISKILKWDKIDIGGMGAEGYHTILIQFIPKLQDENTCIELINTAYKFIREANEN